MKRGIPVVISAPSGAGKSTLCRELLQRDRRLRNSISWTTRSPRPGERDGKDYHFVTHREFRSAMHKGVFLEWARVHGCYYGTPKPELKNVLEKGYDVLLIIDVQGASAVKRLYPEALTIFVAAPTWDELVERLRRRGVNAKDLRVRLANARKELQQIPSFDHAVINDHLEETADKILEIIRRCRRERIAIPSK